MGQAIGYSTNQTNYLLNQRQMRSSKLVSGKTITTSQTTFSTMLVERKKKAENMLLARFFKITIELF